MSLQTENEDSSKSQDDLLDANLFTIIRDRRATRSYLGKHVSDETIKALIDFSILAPSAMNLQPWSFVVIQNPKLLKEISEEAKKRISNNPEFLKENDLHGFNFVTDPDFDIFYDAQTLIVICAKNKEEKQYSAEADCFLAGENLMLAATGMGLATCPIGLATEVLSGPEMKKRLGIGPEFTPVLPIIVGYASSYPSAVERNPPIVKWIR